MQEMQLAYGSGTVNIIFAEDRFEVLAPNAAPREPLSDLQIGGTLDSPIDSPPLEELLTPGETVLIVASDATRATASAQVINLLVRRVIQQGISPADITIIFANGIHQIGRASCRERV